MFWREKQGGGNTSVNIRTVERILSQGGKVVIGTQHPAELVRLATIAFRNDACLTIRGKLSEETILKIMEAGNNNVTFDLS
jgi:hypothetical protein